MNWFNCVDNIEGLRQLFGATEPVLVSIRMHEIAFHQDGPTVRLRFDLNELPDALPEKWRRAGYNKIQVRLMLIGIRTITLEGWSANNLVSLAIKRTGDGAVQLDIESEQCKLKGQFDFARIDQISAYRDG